MMKHRAIRSMSTACVTLVLLGSAALQTAAQEPARTYPSLPGAVRRPPAWLGKDVPFDVAAFSAAPQPGLNAAPLYLDAFFEFSAEMSSCFAPGPETEARAKRAREHTLLRRPLNPYSPSNLDRVALKSALADCKDGFRKLSQAQKQQRCLFETGFGVVSTDAMPHLQAAREVSRVAQLSIIDSLERDDLRAAMATAEVVLQMAHDLQRRGPMVCQLVHVALVDFAGQYLVSPILSHPKLTAAQCSRLIRSLADLESHGIDGYSEGLKAEYLSARTALRDVSGRPGDPDRSAAELSKAETWRRLKNLPALIQDPKQKALPEAILADLPKATPQQYREAAAALNTYYPDVLAAAKLPIARKLARTRSAGGFPARTASAARQACPSARIWHGRAKEDHRGADNARGPTARNREPGGGQAVADHAHGPA